MNRPWQPALLSSFYVSQFGRAQIAKDAIIGKIEKQKYIVKQPTSISRAKSALRTKFPRLAGVYTSLRQGFSTARWTLLTRPRLRRMSPEAVFRWHFKRRVWSDGETVSGPGSTRLATLVLRAALVELIEEHRIKSLLDIPCGDGNWISTANLKLDLYIGADIVQELVDLNQSKWKTPANCRFLKVDLTRDALPQVDLVLCRDGLVHLSNALAMQALKNIKLSGSIYLLATTFPEHSNNADIVTGEWRPMNLQRPPFNLPKPFKLISEQRKTPGYQDKSLGLWRIESLPTS